MLFALMLLAAMPDWVPARWSSADPQWLAAAVKMNGIVLEGNVRGTTGPNEDAKLPPAD
jgi:hypothetical protein